MKTDQQSLEKKLEELIADARQKWELEDEEVFCYQVSNCKIEGSHDYSNTELTVVRKCKNLRDELDPEFEEENEQNDSIISIFESQLRINPEEYIIVDSSPNPDKMQVYSKELELQFSYESR
jgi:hypothetical protein